MRFYNQLSIPEFCGPLCAQYQNVFLQPLLEYIKDKSPEVRQAATYGCGVLAQVNLVRNDKENTANMLNFNFHHIFILGFIVRWRSVCRPLCSVRSSSGRNYKYAQQSRTRKHKPNRECYICNYENIEIQQYGTNKSR